MDISNSFRSEVVEPANGSTRFLDGFSADAADGAGASLCEGASASKDLNWIAVGDLIANAADVGGAIVASAAMRETYRKIARLARYQVGLLVQGESGTGKELVARAIHMMGPVPEGPFVTFNCSNLVDSLAEAQLFGHAKGAFTDARENSTGFFRSADGGTLFLDEVGELPFHLQPKLLRALETHEVQPVGSPQPCKVNIRVVAATNRDLRAMVKAGQFRDDLYYRLNAGTVLIPALRERPGEIPALVGHFIDKYNSLFGKRIKFVARDALKALMDYEWPGNVRELSNAIQRAMLLADDAVLADIPIVEDVRFGFESGGDADERPSPSELRDDLPGADAADYRLETVTTLATIRALVRAMREARGNRARAADLLGISRYTVYRMIERFELSESDWAASAAA